LANWWDAVALWLSDLAFPFQFALVIAVLAPLCLGLAWAIDRAVDLITAGITRSKDDSLRVRVTERTAVALRADVPAGTPATIVTTVLTPRHEDEPAVHS
jgi:hypothetical protein